MTLFACAAKLGSGAYSARHIRAMLSVMQWVLAVREAMVIKPSRLDIVAQSLSNFPRYTPLSRVGSDQAQVCWRSPLGENRKIAQQLHYTHTVRQAWWCRATLHLTYP